MVNKWKQIRKSATLTSTIIAVLIIMGVFFGMYAYFSNSLSAGGATLDSKYSDTYNKLNGSAEELNTQTEGVRAAAQNISEAENVVQVAWNGLKGLGKTVKLTFGFADILLDVWDAFATTLDIVPNWAIALAFTGILVFIVFLIVSVLKGEPKM